MVIINQVFHDNVANEYSTAIIIIIIIIIIHAQPITAVGLRLDRAAYSFSNYRQYIQ